MKNILKRSFVKDYVKWLFLILAFEYIVAINISPTVLTDYPLLKGIVESLDFIPAIKNIGHVPGFSEAVIFYIALAFIFLIPKSICIYFILADNPVIGMEKFVITPYTVTKPAETNLMYRQRLARQDGNGQKTILQKPRSISSRIIWSLLILLFSFGFIAIFLHIGTDPSSIKENSVVLTWYNFSIQQATFCGLFIAISVFIIKDYIRLFISIGKKALFINE